MITYQLLAGTANVSVVIRIVDDSDGTPETGVTSATSGLDLQYRREGAAVTDLTESDLSALTDAHSDGGMLHIGNGYYRVDLPDAATAAGATGVLVEGSATGMVVIGCYIQLLAVDLFDSVRAGLTALPNAAADAAGGLPVSDAGGLDLDARLDAAVSSRLAPTVAARTLDVTAGGAAGVDWGNVENPGTTVDLSATDINLVDTCSANTDMRGTDNAALASVLGALADAAAAGDPTSADTLMQYVKQLINVLIGTAGVVTFPAESAPGNAVSLAEVIRAIHADVTGLNGDAMRGTDGANTTTPPTAAAVADQVWDEAKSGHVGAGSFGEEVQAHALTSEVSAVETDTQDIQSRLPSALVGGKMDADATSISGDSTAADRLEALMDGVLTAAAEGTPSTTVIQTDLAETTDDQYIGRLVTFLTGAAAGEQTDITDYTGSTGTITVTALANAPSAGDLMVIH